MEVCGEDDDEDEGAAFASMTVGISLKYDPVSVRPRADSLKLSVKDAVEGMSEEDLERLTRQCREVFYHKSLAQAVQEAFM